MTKIALRLAVPLVLFWMVTVTSLFSQQEVEQGGFRVVHHDGATVILRTPDGTIRSLEELSGLVKITPPSFTPHSQPSKTLAAFVVTDASDAADSDILDDIVAPATLRSVIQNANKQGVAASISFSPGLTTIAPASNLPSVTVAVTIDGTVAAGKIILDGTAVASNGYGLLLGSNSTVQNVSFRNWTNVGLAFGNGSVNMTAKRNEFFNNKTGLNINSNGGTVGGDDPQDGNVAANNTQTGISLVFANNIIIKNNLIGTKDGFTAAPNQTEGMYVLGSNNRVLRNVISGNNNAGLGIGEYSVQTLVKDNLVGLDSTGRGRLGNYGNGIQSFGDGDSILSNVIAGNAYGINIYYQSAGSLVQGNTIGPNRTLDSLFSNSYGGIQASGYPMRIDSNIISGNKGNGININGIGNVTVTRNKIGTDPTGTLDWGNQWAGIYIGCDFNTIGGPSPSDGNLLSGNGGGGIEMYGGWQIVFGGPSGPNWVQGNVIQHNKFGTDITGTARIPNFTGLFMEGYIDSNFVRDNLISGNNNHGVWTRRNPSAPTRNVWQRNLIGTQADGVSPLPNDSCGIMIDSSANNIFGGLNEGEGNTIAFSNQAGVAIKAGWGALFQRNSIHHNKGMAIDLGYDGPTPNDAGDVDLGPHRKQNFPRITWVHSAGGLTAVKGRLESRPQTTFRLEFYTNDQADSTGFGEAQTFQSSIDVNTDSAGIAPFDVILTGSFGRVVGTATDPDYGTSEVSKAPFVVNSTADRSDADPLDGLASTTGPQVNGNPEVTLRSALQASNHVVGEDDITFDIPNEGAQFILPQSQLTQANGDVTIDGTTQPGFVYGTVPLIQVLGTNAGSNATGLRFAGDRSTVRGLYLSGFTGDGISTTGEHLTLGDLTANANKKNGVSATYDLTLDGETIFSGNGPAAPSAASCLGDEAAGIKVGRWLRGKGSVTVSGNCGPGIRKTVSVLGNGGIALDAKVTATGNAGSGIWSFTEVRLKGERFDFTSNGLPKKTANGVRVSQGDLIIEATGGGTLPVIRASGNSHTGLLAEIGSIELIGKAEVSNNGAGLTVVECLNQKVTGIKANDDIRAQDLAVVHNGFDGIKAGNNIFIDGNLTASNHYGRGVWAIVDINLDGTEHRIENNLDGGMWAANGWLNVKGKLIAKGNKVGAHHGVEDSPDRTDALIGAVEAYLGINAEDLEIHDNVPSGMTTWEAVRIRGNIDIRNNAVRGISALRGITIIGTNHVVSGNKGDGIVTNQEPVIVKGSILLEGNGGLEGDGYGIVGSNMELENVTARGNVLTGVRGYGTVTVRGQAVLIGNGKHGIHTTGLVTVSGGRICDNGGYGIAAPIVRMSGVEVCNNGSGGISGRVLPPQGGAPGVVPEFTPANASFRTLTPPALAASIIRGSSITGNNGIGVDVDGPYPFRIEGSNLSGNTGVAVNATGGGNVTANANWWGSAAGPGSGISGSVTAAAWLGSAVGIYIGGGTDSVYVLPGDTGAVSIVAANWSAAADSFTVDASDSRGWLTPVTGRPVVQKDSVPSVTTFAYAIPEGAVVGDSSKVVVAGSGQLSPGSIGRDTLVLVVYTPSLYEIAILADTITAAPGDTVRLTAAGFDQSGRAIAFIPTWSATGGTIDSVGVYSVGENLGLHTVRVTHTASGLKDSAYVRVVAPLGAVPGTIAASAATLNAGIVAAGTQSLIPLAITNTAGGLLKVDSLKTLTTVFAPVWDPTISLLRAEDTLWVEVLFAPTAAVIYTDTLYVYNSSPNSPLKIALTGNGGVTGVVGESSVPTVYSLDQNYPNPFNPTTTIRFGLPVASRVRLTVHDILGREIAQLADGIQKEGFVTVTWSPQVASGVYFFRLEATGVSAGEERFTKVKRMVLLK